MSEQARGFEHAVDQYVATMERFAQQNELPAEWFGEPDHVAVKCLDDEHYEEMVATYKQGANFASSVRMNGRRLATIHLGHLITLGAFGSVDWLEIMEPRPEKVGLDMVGIDHAEFVYPEFGIAQALLANRHIPYELQSNQNHAWLNIPINQMGQELKLNDRPLADIVAHAVQTGVAVLL